MTGPDGRRIARARHEPVANRLARRPVAGRTLSTNVATVVMKDSCRPLLPVVLCAVMGMLYIRA
jgi:hypothetical protein